MRARARRGPPRGRDGELAHVRNDSQFPLSGLLLALELAFPTLGRYALKDQPPAYAAALDRWTEYHRRHEIEAIGSGVIILRKFGLHLPHATTCLRYRELR